METEITTVTATMSTAPVKENNSKESTHADPISNSKPTQRPSREQVEGLVNDLNKSMQEMGTRVSFSVDSDTKRTVIKVIDTATKEVVRQIPPEAMLRVSENITKLLGLMVDRAA